MATGGSSAGTEVAHLVVFIHGFWGNPDHLSHVRDTLLATKKEVNFQVLIAQSNRDNNTYDGIEVGAERITHEIHEIIDGLKADGTIVRKFSIVGYSLGGLIARYVIGLLYADKLFESGVDPINFTTFASPHIGVRSPKKGYQVDAWNWLGSNLLSSSGQQLYLTDRFRDTGRPLLAIMADPSLAFMKGLRSFQKRTVYANIQHDPAVPYFSAAFSRHDEYIDMAAVDIHYLQDKDLPSQQVLLDPAQPVTKKQLSEEAPQTTWLDSFTLSERTRENLPFYAIATAVLPIGVPLFLANAGYQTYRSSARVRSHETGDKIDLARYRSSLFEGTQRAQDAMVEAMDSTSGEQFLDSPSPDLTDDKSEWPVLALTDEQFKMIKSLEAAGFTKYHCYIRTRRAHAAIIVRQPTNPNLGEGKIIVQHWANNFKA